MDELEKLRADKVQRLQAAQQEQQEFAQQFAQLESLVKPHMTPEALARYGNLKVAHKERCVQAMVHLAKLIEAKRIRTIDDKTFKLVLMRLQDGTSSINITYK